MKIGDAAARLGIPPHVLRHWEDAAVLTPPRSAGGHRDYSDDLLARGRLILLCQAAGMSLGDIASLVDTDITTRVRRIRKQRVRIGEQITALARGDEFLAHVLDCRHPVVADCPDCSAFAESAVSGRSSGRRTGRRRVPTSDLSSRTHPWSSARRDADGMTEFLTDHQRGRSSLHQSDLPRIAHECDVLAARLTHMSAELRASPIAGPPHPVAAPPVPTTWPPPWAGPWAGPETRPPNAPPPRRHDAGHVTGPGHPAGPGRPSLLHRLAAASDGRMVGMALSVAGVVVVLVGVVFLLVLAAHAGLLRPEVRVAAGAVLATGLLAVGGVLRQRALRVGSVAFAGAGFAAGVLDVVAVTATYHWWPSIVGLVVVGAVVTAGLGLARRWRSEPLALVATLALVGAAPFVADGLGTPLVGTMSVVSAVAVAVTLDLPWRLFHLARVAAGVLWLIPTIALAAFGGATVSDQGLLVAASAVAALLGVVASGGVSHRYPGSPIVWSASTTAIGLAPALLVGAAVAPPMSAALLFAVTVGLLSVLVPTRTVRWPSNLAAVWWFSAALCALVGVAIVVPAPALAPTVAGLACGVAVLDRGGPVVRWVGVGYTVIASCAFLARVPVEMLVSRWWVSPLTTIAVPVAGVLLVTAAWMSARAFTRASTSTGADDLVWPWVAVGVAGVYAYTASCVVVGTGVGGLTHGFRAGHLAATLGWVCVAAVLFAVAARRSSTRQRARWLGGGLVLAGAATAKLFLFDLATLAGVWRIAAFIFVGLLLLAIGSRYAREHVAGR